MIRATPKRACWRTPGGRARTGPLAGKRVVGEINAGCGTCPVCCGTGGLDARHCPHRSVLGILGRAGAFAERLTLPDSNLLEVPDAVPDTAAVFVEPLAAAFQILEAERPCVGTRVLVAGDGRLGVLIAKVLPAAGCAVDLAGHHAERVPAGIGARTGELDEPCPLAFDERYELVVDATGNPAVLESLFPWVRPKGTLVLKTTAARSSPLDLTPLVVDEIRLVGSRCGRFEPALAALASGAIEVNSMIHGVVPLAEIGAALEAARRPGVLKILIQCSTQ